MRGALRAVLELPEAFWLLQKTGFSLTSVKEPCTDKRANYKALSGLDASVFIKTPPIQPQGQQLAMSNIILARERLRISADDLHRPAATIILFDVPIIPHTPLCVGQDVKILALESCAGLFPTEGQYKPPYYTTKETGIEGRITRIRAVDATVTEFVVKNGDRFANATYAYVAIQHIQGHTVRLSVGRRILRAATRPATGERRIPLELDATIFWAPPSAVSAARGTGPVERRLETAGRGAGWTSVGQGRGCAGESGEDGEDEDSSAGEEDT